MHQSHKKAIKGFSSSHSGKFVKKQRDKFKTSSIGLDKLPALKSKYNIEVAKKQNAPLSFDELALVGDFYDIVKQFSNFNDKNFSKNPELHEVVEWLGDECEKFFTTGEWYICDGTNCEEEAFNPGTYGSFILVNFIDYPTAESTLFNIPIGWITLFDYETPLFGPTKREKSFYRLLTAYFGRFLRSNGITTWQDLSDEMFFGETIRMRIDDTAEEEEELENLKKGYEFYESGKYAQILDKLLSDQTSLAKIRKMLYSYEPANLTETSLIYIMKKGFDLLDTKYCVGYFSTPPPEYAWDENEIIRPVSYVTAFWSNDDFIEKEYMDFLEQWHNQSSSIPFMDFKVYTKKETEIEKLIETDYPVKLLNFIEELSDCLQNLNLSY